MKTTLKDKLVRLSAMILGIAVAGNVWATTLSYNDFISHDSSNPSTVFEGVTLSEIGTKYALAATFGGAWMQAGDAVPWTLTRSVDSVVVVFRRLDTGSADYYCKSIKVTFTSDGNGSILAYQSEPKYIRSNYITDTPNTAQNSTDPDGSGNPVYRVSSLALLPKGQININFHNGTALSDSDSTLLGVDGYAVPVEMWDNKQGNNGELTTVHKYDGSGITVITDAKVAVSNASGSWECNSLSATTDLRKAYIDDNANKTSPTVTITNIPFDYYKVIVYHSNEDTNKKFGYDLINGVCFSAIDGQTVITNSTSASWGDSGAKNSALALAEGTNYLITPVFKNNSAKTMTLIAHRFSTNVRAGVAAISIVEEVAPETVGAVSITSPFDGSTLAEPTHANEYYTSATHVSFGNSSDFFQPINNRTGIVAKVTGGTYTDINGWMQQAEGTTGTDKDVYLVVSGGTMTRINGVQEAHWQGNNRQTRTTGSAYVQIEDGATVGHVFAAGYKGGVTTDSQDPQVDGSTGVTIKGGTITGSIVGGWSTAHQRNARVTGNTAVRMEVLPAAASAAVENALVNNYIVGGSVYQSNRDSASTIGGNSSVTLSLADKSGAFLRNIVGGSFIGSTINNGGYSTISGAQAVTGNSSVSITAANDVTFGLNIVGGGSDNVGSGSANVGGNSSIAINGGTYTGTIVAGGYAPNGGTANVSGKATLTLNSGVFTGTIVAGGYAPNGGTANVSGKATLTLNSGVFTGATLKGGTATGVKELAVNNALDISDATVQGFTQITVSGNGKVAIADTEFANLNAIAIIGAGGEIEVSGSATTLTIPADSSVGSQNYVNNGTLDLTGCTALTELVLELGSATSFDLSHVSLPASCTSVVVNGAAGEQRVWPYSITGAGEGVTVSYSTSFTETREEFGKGNFSVSSVPAGATISVSRPDGTVATPAVTDGTARLADYGTIRVSGKACWVDYEMDYESGVRTGWENSGFDTTNLHKDSDTSSVNIEGDDAFYNGMLYTYAHPYRDDMGTLPENWTAVVRCTVPKYENAVVITFGWYDNMIGLVAGADPETEMKLIRTTGDSAFSTLQTMTVQNAATAQHVYIFSVENSQTIKVYCDGEQVLDETFDSFTVTRGFQVGSALGGVHETGVIRFAKNESPANTLSAADQTNARIDCVRMYDYVISDAQVDALRTEFPAVKLYRGTVTTDTAWDSISFTPAWDGGNEYSKIILTVTDDATVTLPASITVADFEIDIADGKTLTLAGTCSLNVTNPIEVNGGKLDATGATITGGGISYAPSSTGTIVYQWTGGGSDTNWTTPANWGLSSGYPNASTAEVVFDDDATVTVGGIYSVGSVYPAAGVTVTLQRSGSTNGQLSYISNLGNESIVGDKIVLNGVNLESSAMVGGANKIWYADIEIAANSAVTNTIYCRNADASSSIAHLDLYGNLTGAGNLQLARDGHTASGVYDGRGGVSLYGNNESFAGVCIIRSGSSTRGPATFKTPTSGSALARWIYPDAVDQNTSAEAGSVDVASWTGDTIKFGSYEGKSYILGFDSPIADGITLEIGGSGESFTSELSAKCRTNADRGHKNITIKKTGDGVMTFGNTLGQPYVSTWNIAAGTLKFANSSIVSQFDGGGHGGGTRKYATFTFTGGTVAFDDDYILDISPYVKNSTSAILVDVAETQSITWSSALANSNTGGLTKKGAGTLTLSASPAYTGATTVSAGTLVLPRGFTFPDMVAVADGAYIEIVGDPTWEDASEQTIVTFAEGKVPEASVYNRIRIAGLNSRQTYEYSVDGSGNLVATITTPNIVWNGENGANWTDSNVWLADDTPTSYTAGDHVVFADSSFAGETTEMIVNIPANVDPASVTISPAAGHAFKFTGAGKVTRDITVAATGAGTVTLANDVFSGLEIETSGMVEIDADEGTVSLAKVTSSATSTALTVSSGSLTLTEGLGCYIDNEATLILDGAFNLNTFISGSNADAELIIRGTIDRSQDGLYTWLNDYAGKFVLEEGATYKYSIRNSGSQYHNKNVFGNGTVVLKGGTISSKDTNSPAETFPANAVEIEDGATVTFSKLTGSADRATKISLSGTLSGGGTFNSDRTLALNCTEAAGFNGTVNWIHNVMSSYDNVTRATATSEDAAYNVTGAPASAAQLIGLNFSGTAKMGAFSVSSANAQIGINNASVALEIGNKADSTINGQFITNPLTMTKVGSSSTLSLGSAFSMVSGSTININEGTFASDATSFTGVNFTFANKTKMTHTLAEESDSTDDVELLRTTGTITLTGTQTVTLENSTATGVTWILKTEQIDTDDDSVNDTYVLYATAKSDVVVETVTITGDWLAANELESKTSEELAADRAAGESSNGYSYLACYALGLDPTDAADKPFVSVTVGEDGNFVVSVTDKAGNALDTASNVEVTTTFTIYDSPTAGSGTVVVDPTSVDPADVVGEGSVGYIKARIDISPTTP